MAWHTIAAQSGIAFQLRRNSLLSIRDPMGQQVSDLFCIDANQIDDGFSSGRTIDYNESIYLKIGDILYSNSGRRLMQIADDDCGRHDVLVTPCSQQMFNMIDPTQVNHPSCLTNLANAIAKFGVPERSITSTFNIFMNISVHAETGKISIHAPLSKSGDTIQLRACIDLIVGLTACSDEGTNNGVCKPIEYRVQEK